MSKNNDNARLKPETAEAMMNLSAEIITSMHKAQVATPELDWLMTVTSAAVACRAAAAQAMSTDSTLDFDTARILMLNRFIEILSAPAELVRVISDESDKNSLTTIVIPPRKPH